MDQPDIESLSFLLVAYLVQGGDSLLYAAEGDRSANIEGAITSYETALKQPSLRTNPGLWARATVNLSEAYLARREGDPEANTQRAIATCVNALDALAPDVLMDVLHNVEGRVTFAPGGEPQGGAEIMHQLGAVHMASRFGDRGANIEIAIRAFRQAAAWTPSYLAPIDHAVELSALASAYLNRLEGDQQSNREQQVELQEQAVRIFAEQSDTRRWAAATTNMATAYLTLGGDSQEKNVERAVDLYREVLAVRSRETDPIGWASSAIGLANALLMLAKAGRPDNLRPAIQLYNDILTEVSPQREPVMWVEALLALAAAYRVRPTGRRSENLKRAAGFLQQVIADLPADFHPSLRRRILGLAAEIQLELRHWETAEPLYAAAIDLDKALFETAIYEAARSTEVSAGAALYADHAYCLLRAGRYGEALVQLESGKTRLLASAMALTAARLESLDPALREQIAAQRDEIRQLEQARQAEKTRDRFSLKMDDSIFVGALATARARLKQLLDDARALRPDLRLNSLTLPEILTAIPQDTALVAPVFTTQGSAIFVVPHGAAAVTADHVVRLDRFTREDLAGLLLGANDRPGWLSRSARRVDAAPDLRSVVEPVTAALWTGLGRVLARKLKRLAVHRIVLLPQGGLGLLPLHIAWRDVRGKRRYLLDDFEVGFAPSAYVYYTALERAAKLTGRSALIAGVGEYVRLPDLLYARVEVTAIAEQFGVKPLLDQAVTLDALLRTRAGKGIPAPRVSRGV